MNLLDLIKTEMKRVGNKDGGEYAGACPFCGGEDRFRVWREQNITGTYWCRKCGKRGDAIQYLRDVEGVGYKEACRMLGQEPKTDDIYLPPVTKKTAESKARECKSPVEQWIEHSQKIVEKAHADLMKNAEKKKWLFDRGITLDSIIKYRLGWLQADEYRSREAFGLSTELRTDGKPKKLWFPAGVVIPYFQQGVLHRVRIRRETGEPRYYLTPGSGTAPFICDGNRDVCVIVESELDAITIDSTSSTTCTAIALGNNCAAPDAIADEILRESIIILVALDNDTAGASEFPKWKQRYSQSIRWCVTAGKDPGEAYQKGEDLDLWIKSALPISLIKERTPQKPAEPEPQMRALKARLKDRMGREYILTDSKEVYRECRERGEVVISTKELAMAKQFIAAAADPQKAADLIMEVKQLAVGSYISKVNIQGEK